MQIDAFWQRFLKETNRDQSTQFVDCFHFELTKALANALLDLVLQGKKKATACSLPSFHIDGLPLPQVGDFYIVTNWDNIPHCVIETTKVTKLAYKDMTYDIAKLEGEDDTLASWQRGHAHFFREEGKIMGYTFTEDLIIVFEEFRVIYQINYPINEDYGII